MLKMPAVIVRAQPPAELLTAGRRDRYPLMAAAIRDQRRGLIEIEWDAPRWNQQACRYELKVRRLKEPAPAWRKRAMVTGIALTALGVLAVLAWHALTALSPAALALFLAAVAGAFALLVARGRHTDVSVTTTTTVRVRR
jgi:hypothetical protein